MPTKTLNQNSDQILTDQQCWACGEQATIIVYDWLFFLKEQKKILRKKHFCCENHEVESTVERIME